MGEYTSWNICVYRRRTTARIPPLGRSEGLRLDGLPRSQTRDAVGGVQRVRDGDLR